MDAVEVAVMDEEEAVAVIDEVAEVVDCCVDCRADCGMEGCMPVDAAVLADDANADADGNDADEAVIPPAAAVATFMLSTTAHRNARANLLRRTANGPAIGREDADGNVAVALPSF